MPEITVHQYFTDQARAVFTRAGGDPDRSAALAEWAQRVRPTCDSRLGVIVAATGEILAETRHVPNQIRAGGTYVTAATSDADTDQVHREVGLATAALTRRHGPSIHVKFSEVCTGAGHPKGVA